MATFERVMEELREAGSAQTVKTYRRHGVTGEQFGVSYAKLGQLRKAIKTDHALARALWASGNHDARVLATMIADPQQTSTADLDAWLAEADNPVQADALVTHVAARVPGVWGQAQRWATAEREWTAYAGWELLDLLALQDKSRPDADFLALLQTIEADIHGSKNLVRYAMNNAVIAIGSRNPTLAAAARVTAQRIGHVEVDHGDTGCKTPDALAYIDKVWARKSA